MSVLSVGARASRPAGFSLVEAVLAITIVAIAPTVVMGQLPAANSHSARVLLAAALASVAEAYLDKIIGRPFEDPGGGTRERRRVDFDDIDDYDRLLDRGARNARGLLVAAGATRENVADSVSACRMTLTRPATGTQSVIDLAIAFTRDGETVGRLRRTLATGSQGQTLEISHARARFATRAGLEWAKYWIARKKACYDGSLPLTEGALAGFAVEVTCTQTDHPHGASSSAVFALAAFAQFASFGSPNYVSLRMTETVGQ